MSKESKPRDRWSQVFTAARDRVGMCSGCGYYLAVYGQHRADCTHPDTTIQRGENGQAHCTTGDHLADLYTLQWTGTEWSCRDCTHAPEPVT